MPVNNWCRTVFKGCCWLREKSFERKKRFVNFSNIQPTWFLSCFKVPCLEGKESMAMKELFKVLKDHSNPFMQELVTASYQQCFISEVESILQDSEEVVAQRMLWHRECCSPQPSGAQLTTGRTHSTKRRSGRS